MLRLAGKLCHWLFDALPDDMGNDGANNKDLFISIMIPLAVMVNEQTAAERQPLCNPGYRGPINAAPLLVRQIADRYDVTTDVDTLLLHVDTLPVSLMIAQAIEESGWGTGRFAQEGNALFGQYTWEATTGAWSRRAARPVKPSAYALSQRCLIRFKVTPSTSTAIRPTLTREAGANLCAPKVRYPVVAICFRAWRPIAVIQPTTFQQSAVIWKTIAWRFMIAFS